MAYATVAMVAELMAQFTIGSATKPSTAQTDVIIDQVADEIDTALAVAGVLVPVTSPVYFLGWLEGLNSAGATARVLKSMFPGTTGAGETPAYAFYQRIYTDGVKGIQNGTMIPPDAVEGSRTGPTTYFTSHSDEEEDLGTIAEPFFQRGKSF